MRRLLVFALLAAGVGIVPAAQQAVQAAPRCDVAPTNGLEIHSPYADTSALQGQGDGTYPRTYELYVPPGLPSGPVPLLISIHGLLGNAVQQAGQTDWANYFTTVNPTPVIVAWPNGPERWDTRPQSEDVQFIRDVVADIRADRCIDPRRIYAVGHSYGAFMVQRLVCDAGDLFAAGASYAGGDIEGSAVGGPCNAGTGEPGAPPDPAGYLPVPLGMWHGTADSIVNYKDELRSQTRLRPRRHTAPRRERPAAPTTSPTPPSSRSQTRPARCSTSLRTVAVSCTSACGWT
ncbi:MAG TPA: prolyl oligopeptidase family serine peptidase [Mycobacteriales bacterium]|nr:prolyl oligopeptidase family serine peptidase [Mycobacteriales bacterium]